MKPILNIENLTKVYGTLPNQTRALNGITFQVMPGEFLGIMGSSGSGKSTLLNCIATVIQPTGGSIQVEGDTLQSLKEKALAEYRGKKVGYLFQNFELLDNLTGRENILGSCQHHRGCSVPDESAENRAQIPDSDPPGSHLRNPLPVCWKANYLVYGTSCIGCGCQQFVWSQGVIYRDTLVPNPWDSG